MGPEQVSANSALARQRSEARASRIARLCGFALVLTMPAALLIAEVGRLLFDPLALSRALGRVVFESQALPAGLAWLAQSSPEGNPTFGGVRLFAEPLPLLRLAAGLDSEQWAVLLAELTPPAAGAEWIEDTARGFDRWLDGSGSLEDISYNLAPLKQRAQSASGLKALQMAFDALPPCAPSEVPGEFSQAGAGAIEAERLYLVCALPEPWSEDQFAAYAELVPELVGSVRTSFTMAEAINPFGDPLTGAFLDSARGGLRWARTLTALAPVLPLALLAAIALLRARSWTELGVRWFPWLAAGGLLTASLALARSPILRAGLEVVPLGHPLLSAALFEAASAVVDELAGPLLVRGIAAVALASALRAYAVHLERRAHGAEGAEAAPQAASN